MSHPVDKRRRVFIIIIRIYNAEDDLRHLLLIIKPSSSLQPAQHRVHIIYIYIYIGTCFIRFLIFQPGEGFFIGLRGPVFHTVFRAVALFPKKINQALGKSSSYIVVVVVAAIPLRLYPLFSTLYIYIIMFPAYTAAPRLGDDAIQVPIQVYAYNFCKY